MVFNTPGLPDFLCALPHWFLPTLLTSTKCIKQQSVLIAFSFVPVAPPHVQHFKSKKQDLTELNSTFPLSSLVPAGTACCRCQAPSPSLCLTYGSCSDSAVLPHFKLFFSLVYTCMRQFSRWYMHRGVYTLCIICCSILWNASQGCITLVFRWTSVSNMARCTIIELCYCWGRTDLLIAVKTATLTPE